MALRRDTAGQERYASLAPLYYRGASAAAIVYDITSTESFAKAKHWISELHKNASGDIGTLMPNIYDVEYLLTLELYIDPRPAILFCRRA